MAVEINTAGYQDIRDVIETGSGGHWKYVELRDDQEAAWGRLDLDTDERVSWTHAPGAQTLEMTIEISGDDEDITLPQTFEYVALFKVATEGDEMADGSITSVTLEQTTDQVVIKAQIQVPEVV